ncbi:hypothetical protein PMAYCL1PPCAC_03095, partial [Pristionchus mayeri]
RRRRSIDDGSSGLLRMQELRPRAAQYAYMQQVRQAQQLQQIQQARMYLQQQALLRQAMYARARQEMAWKQLRMEQNRRATLYQNYPPQTLSSYAYAPRHAIDSFPTPAIPQSIRRMKRSIQYGPSRVNDVYENDDGKKTWKNFEIDPNASVTMPREEFVRMMKHQRMQQLRVRAAQYAYMQQVRQAQQMQQMQQARVYLQQQALLRQAMYARAKQEMAWKQMQSQYGRFQSL